MLETGPLGLSKYFLLLFFTCTVYAQTFPDKKADALLKHGIDLLLNQEYETADSTFQVLQNEFPKLPFGKIYRAANSIAKSLDLGEEFKHDFISNNLEDAVELSEKKLDEDENDIWNNYFMALSKGYLAYYLALEEEYVDAFSEGFYSISFFERCEKMSPDFYESKIASGTFLYWKSEKADWLPFVGNDKQKGIDYLEEVIKHKSYNYYVAVNSLLWIYINEKEYLKAVETADIVLNKYPGNRYFQWGLARAYEGINEEKAIEVYDGILKALDSMNSLNVFNEVTLKHKIAQLYERMGNFKTALKYCTEILSIKNIPEEEHERLSNRLERVKEQEEKLRKLLKGH